MDLLEALAAESPADTSGKTAKSEPINRRQLSCAVHGADFDLVEWMRRYCPEAVGPEPYKDGLKWIFGVCPWNSDHTNRSAFVIRGADGKIGAGCHHDHCQQHGWKELRAMKEPGCYGRATLPTALANPAGDGDTEKEVPIEAVSAGDLLAEYPQLRRPVVHGLLRESETANVISQAKIGKTILAIGMGLCIRTGRAWLGTFQVEAGNVLYIDAELHRETFSRRLHAVAQAMGILSDEFREGFDVLSLRGRLRNIMQLAPVFRAIPKGKYKAIFLDALYRLLPPDCEENSNSDMAKVFNQIDIYAEWTGAAIVVVHHASKGNQSGKSVVDVGSGASAQARAVDCHLILREHKEDGCVVLDAAARSWPPPSPIVLGWQYPVWTPRPDLDPADLKQPNQKRGKSKIPPTLKPVDPLAPAWTPETFAGKFIGAERLDKADVLATARAAGLSGRMADDLLRLALQAGMAHRWTIPKDRTVYVANQPQPAIEITETP